MRLQQVFHLFSRIAGAAVAGDAGLVHGLEALRATLLQAKAERDAMKKDLDDAVAKKVTHNATLKDRAKADDRSSGVVSGLPCLRSAQASATSARHWLRSPRALRTPRRRNSRRRSTASAISRARCGSWRAGDRGVCPAPCPLMVC